MKFDMTEASTQDFTQVPFFLPRLFVSPSCLPKFSNTFEDVARKKAELLSETTKRQDAMQKRDQERVHQLGNKCETLRLNIKTLESEAYEMRLKLVKQIHVEVSSAKEMRAVHELWSGTGAGAKPGMKCFRGSVYVSMNVHKDVKKAIVMDCKSNDGPVILFYTGYDYKVSLCLTKGILYRVGSPNSFYRIGLDRLSILGF